MTDILTGAIIGALVGLLFWVVSYAIRYELAREQAMTDNIPFDLPPRRLHEMTEGEWLRHEAHDQAQTFYESWPAPKQPSALRSLTISLLKALGLLMVPVVLGAIFMLAMVWFHGEWVQL